MSKQTKNPIYDTISGHPFERMMTVKEWSLFETNRNNPELMVLPYRQSLPYYTMILLSGTSYPDQSIQKFAEESFFDFITYAFFISDSPEGFDFWNDIANRTEEVR